MGEQVGGRASKSVWPDGRTIDWIESRKCKQLRKLGLGRSGCEEGRVGGRVEVEKEGGRVEGEDEGGRVEEEEESKVI